MKNPIFKRILGLVLSIVLVATVLPVFGIAQNLPACSDGIDNDLDGYIDYPSDSHCDTPYDNDESSSSAQANRPPFFASIPNQTIQVNSYISFVVSAVDPEGDYVTYQVLGKPASATFDEGSRRFSWIPSISDIGTHYVTIRARDIFNNTQTITFSITVTPVNSIINQNNRAPQFINTNQSYQIRVGEYLVFRVTAVDPDGDFLTYRALNLPAGAGFVNQSAEFTWRPEASQVGSYNVVFEAVDQLGLKSQMTVNLRVTSTVTFINAPNTFNNRPQFTSLPPLTAVANQTYLYTVKAYDSEGQMLTYQLAKGPAGAFLNSQTGVLAFTPTANSQGSKYDFIITATDSGGMSNQQNFTVTVAGQPAPLVITQPGKIEYVELGAQSTYTNQVVTTQPQVVLTRASQLRNFDYRVYNDSSNNVIVAWSTSVPSVGEVVFGYNAQTDIRSGSLDYDFTTGRSQSFSTYHEFNLGKLDFNRPYYIRTISFNDTESKVSSETLFIPVPYNGAVMGEEESVIGTASVTTNLYTASAVASITVIKWILLTILSALILGLGFKALNR